MSPRSKKLSESMRMQSREALIRAARKLFAEQGYFNCTVSEIALRAGMIQGNLYWYFESKEALLKAVLADGFESLGKTLEQAAGHPGTALRKLEALIDGILAFGRERGDFNAIMLSIQGHGGEVYFKELGFDMPQIGLGYTRSVATIIAQGQQEGVLEGDTDPTVLTMFFFGLFNGLNLTYGQDWLELPRDSIRGAVLRLVGAPVNDLSGKEK
jgi:AcrR family transcriptional regulator